MSNQTTEVQIAERRWANRQALANASIEGFVPCPEFLGDCEAVIQGEMTEEESRARSLARALAVNAAAAAPKA
jgi:hypothetical protein